LANVVAVLLLADWETIPFHFVWVSLTLVYGFRVWSAQTTGVLLVAVVAFTGSALVFAVVRSNEGFDELSEVPLMAVLFVVMVWHARRRQAAVDEARRRAEAEHLLRERQREFVRDASHELRTPITVARGHAELLRAATHDPQAIRDIDVVIDELARLSRLSERLLLLAASENANFLRIGVVDVDDLVRDVGRRWSGAADRSWSVEPGAEGVISGDGDRLRDAADALVENAVHATGPGARIAIRGRASDGRFVLEVADEGVGIDPAQIPLLFEPFSRVDAPRSRHGGGTGLGLSIVKAIAEAHGGEVDAVSIPGRGATFRVVLPGLRPSGNALPGERPGRRAAVR
jgi:signal transduction histidine kinase